ncbi:MAG TPA: amidohydrolase family protein [Blastocatellia bacterium]|nr:amidohydrolase family protein [Blastocatellia bacterium]
MNQTKYSLHLNRLSIVSLVVLFVITVIAQAPVKELTFEEYEPKSTLKVAEHLVPKAKFPFVDIHSHHSNLSPEYVDKLVKEMDSINLQVMVNLSGGTGERLKQVIAAMKGRYPDRFVVFANLSFNDLNEPGYGERAADRLAEDVKNGAQGLKIFKNYGMDLKRSNGERVKVDDPEFDPVWEMCAKLKIPVLIHTAEPDAFFLPIDKHNERWLELKQFPQRARPADRYPTFETLMQERNSMIAKHPNTSFILAHLGYHGNDLARLGKLFDTYPNVYVDNAAVLAELGRQPYTARDFLIKYQDRVIFGKDIYEPSEYTYYFRVMETRDDYIEYYRRRHAFWRMYGLYLPDEVLKKIYYQNALKLVKGINSRQFPK